MGDLLKLAEDLYKLTNDKILYLKTEPEIFNFTQVFQGKVLIFGTKHKITIEFTSKEDIINVLNQLQNTVFTENYTIVAWNIKNLVSFFRFHLEKHIPLNIKAKIVDICLFEAFLGIKEHAPASLKEALARMTPYIDNPQCKHIHKHIHTPLMLSVIPSMETNDSIIDTEIFKKVYTSYKIEAQTFGRLSCYKSFDNCITPHNMGDIKKSNLKLCDNKNVFVHFDFKHMEVSMLQWLTGDKALKKIMEESIDLYKGIYTVIFNEPCDTDEKRALIKELFLPVMFGLHPFSLSKERDLPLQKASDIYSLIKGKFIESWLFMESYNSIIKDDSTVVKDYFGRPRTFEKPWSVRGFLVQSASAIFCLEKLIELHKSLENDGKLLYTIHDGYILTTTHDKLNKVLSVCLKSLQSESKMCKGLSIKVACSVGLRLTHMKRIPINKEIDDID